MQTITVHSEFNFSPDGREVVTYMPGQHEVTDQCALYASRKGYAVAQGVTVGQQPQQDQPVIIVPAEVAFTDPLAEASAKAAKPKRSGKAAKAKS